MVNPAPAKLALRTQVTLSYVELGDPRSEQVLVLLPGLGDSWRSYELVFPHLPHSIRTIAVSQRGHGDSDKPSTGYAVRDLATDLGALLDQLGVRRAFLAGHSSGSLVARRFALDRPDRVAGLVLEGSFVTIRDRIPAEMATRFANLRDPISPAFVQGFVAGTFTRPPRQSFVDAMVEDAMKVPARVWREIFDSLLVYDDSAELAALTTPTLIIWGDHDAIIDRAATKALVAAIRSSKLAIHTESGHTPHWETPGRYASDVAAFVRAESSNLAH